MYSRLYTRYVTTLLLVVYVFNQLDRAVFLILMEPIKRTFTLSDTQLGFVSGPALALVYSCLGVPVARWADRSRRINIMAGAIGIWSVMAALSSLVQNFWELVLVRAGVGIGEAGFSAIALSVIGDYHDDNTRPRAVSNFLLGIPIAGVISDLMGGWVNQLYGWRAVFIIAGVPGLLLACLMRGTVNEPVRRPRNGGPVKTSDKVAFKDVLAVAWRRPTLRHMAIAQGLSNVVVVMMGGWSSVYFIRYFQLETGELGTWLALVDGVGVGLGVWLSGYLISRFGSQDPRIKLRLMALAAALAAPLALVVLLSPYKWVALLSYAVFCVPAYFFLGPTAALVQDLVGPHMRATVASVFILIQVIGGAIIGIQLVGFLSDLLTPIAGDSTSGLRWSMSVGALLSIWAAAHFWSAGQSIREEYAIVAT
jgi:MFS family permease